MKETQKIIKYVGISLAVLLIFSIFYGIIYIANMFISDKNNSNKEFMSTVIENSVNNLDIDISSAKVTFKVANDYKVLVSNKDIIVKVNNNLLTIKEKNNFMNINNNDEIIIEIPRDIKFEKVNIDSGAGEMIIDGIYSNSFELSLGAGKVDINNLEVYNSGNIDAGASNLTISNSIINNLDLDIGIGSASINGIITGKSEIDAGVGNLLLNLKSNNYKYIVDKGVGNISLNSKKIKSGTYGNGTNIIDIDGGIGTIEINEE